MVQAIKKLNIKTIYAIIVFLIFIAITAKCAMFSGRMGWEDEAHFWTIIKYCSVPEIFKLMKVEGHMLLWYLVVMPFAKLDFPYPYPMQFLNWAFCVSALVIMWKKAPFNILIKTGIVASPIFVSLFAVHARCYSIGIFFLFLACAFYKDRLKHPYLMFFSLFFAANTSLQGLIGATAIGILFLYDLYKDSYLNNKSYKTPAIISAVTFLTGIMFLFQFSGVSVPDYEKLFDPAIMRFDYLSMFLGVSHIDSGMNILIWKIAGVRLFLFIITLIFATRFRAFFVYFFTFSISVMFFLSFYTPRLWHLAFLFIYFIMAYWIFEEEQPSELNKNLILLFTYIFVFVLCTIKIEPPRVFDFISDVIYKNKKLQEGKLFSPVTPIVLSVILPKLNEKNIFIYDVNGRNLSKYEGLVTYFSKKDKRFEGEDIYKYLDKTKRNFLIDRGEDIREFKDFENVNLKLLIIGKKEDTPFFIYEIMPKK